MQEPLQIPSEIQWQWDVNNKHEDWKISKYLSFSWKQRNLVMED